MYIFSLDIETSSDDINGSLLSIAVIDIHECKKILYAEAKHRKGLFIKPKSMLVNKISMEELDDKSKRTLDEIDKDLFKLIPMGTIALGRNPQFDLSFIKKDLPRTFERFSYRILDLNSYAVGIALGLELDYEIFKKAAYEYADNMMKVYLEKEALILTHHNALYDAQHNVYYLDFLNSTLRIIKKGG